MAQITVDPNTYEGEELEQVIAQTVLRGETIENGLITAHTNIDKRMVIPTLSKSITIKDSVANFSAAGTATLGEKYLDPKAFMINEEYDSSNLNATWFASQQARGREGDFFLPSTLEEAIIEQNAQLNSAFIDASIWHGSVYGGTISNVVNSASTSVVSGIIPTLETSTLAKKLTPVLGVDKITLTAITKASEAVCTASTAHVSLLNDGDVVSFVGASGGDFTELNGQEGVVTILSATTFSVDIDTSGYSGSYTASSCKPTFVNSNNSIAVMTRVYKSINKIMRKDPSFMLHCDTIFADAYRFAQALVANGAGSYFIGEKEMDFLGRKLVELPYIKSNFLVGAKASDLHIGTALSGEQNSAKMISLHDTTLDYVTRYRVDYAFDVNITNDKDLLLYRPA